MARAHGKEQHLKIGATTVSGQMNSIDVDLGGTTSDSTGFGVDSEESIPGLGTGAISATGWYDTTDASTLLALSNTIVTFEYGPEGNGTGKPKISGSCLVTSVKVGGAVRDTLGLSITATKTGDATVGTFT